MIMQYLLEEKLTLAAYPQGDKAIFLFPLDVDTTLDPNATLFSIKNGKNTAAIFATILSRKGLPTLQLSMNNHSHDLEQSIADIYRVIGVGYTHLILPVRVYDNKNNQFSRALSTGILLSSVSDIEPAFPKNVSNRNAK